MKKLSGALAGLTILIVLSLLSCGSASQAVQAQDHVETVYEPSPAESVEIAVPEKKDTSFFASVDKEALAAVETASPDSLRRAYAVLRKNSASYSEKEKILVSIISFLMTQVYQMEAFPVDAPAVTEANPYTGAIESSRQGVYDLSTGNTDFLTLVLPSLVLVTSSSRSDYYAQSEQALLKALELRNDSMLVYYLLGLLYSRQKNWPKAIESFEKASALSSGCFETSYALAETTFRSGDYVKAFALAQNLLVLYMQNTTVLKLCAESSYASGDLPSAEQYVARVLQQEPDNAYYVLFRAKILVARNDYIKAASLLDVYARSDTKSRDYIILRTRVQKEWNRNLTAAARTIEEGLALYPDDEEIVLTAAELAADTGAKIGGKSALSLAEQLLAKDSANTRALKIQVTELCNKKDWNGAYAVSSRLIKMESSSDDNLYAHIQICLNSGHQDEAWKLVSDAYAKKSSDETVTQNYLKVLVATGKKSEAAKLISQLLPSASSRMKSFLFYQRSFLVSGEETVLSDLRSSLTSNPRNKDALFRLYQIYYDKKEYRKAQYYLKQVVALSPSDESLLNLNKELTQLLSH